jgi:hypothetical protein
MATMSEPGFKGLIDLQDQRLKTIRLIELKHQGSTAEESSVQKLNHSERVPHVQDAEYSKQKYRKQPFKCKP